MAVSVAHELLTAVVAQAAAALPGRTVSDGWAVTDDPGDYLMVGVEDPDVDGYATSVDVTQEWANANYTSKAESGDIHCCALSWNGDGDGPTARGTVYQIAADVETVLRQSPSLGVSGVLWTVLGSQLSLNQIQSDSGAVALLLFSIHFEARI